MPQAEPAATPALPEGTTVLDLIDACPGVLEVLEEYGIRLDPWTLIALRSPIRDLAEYSALANPEELEGALARFMERDR